MIKNNNFPTAESKRPSANRTGLGAVGN